MFLTEDYLIELEDNFPSKVVETLNSKGKDLTSEDINEQANRENQSMRQRLKIMARKRIAAMSNQELKDFLFPKTNEFQFGDQSFLVEAGKIMGCMGSRAPCQWRSAVSKHSLYPLLFI